MTVIIDGKTLTIEDVIRVARNNEDVVIAEDAKRAIEKARAYVDEKLSEGAVIYGLTTGFGKFSDTLISKEETAKLQRNLIISHSCGMGKPLSREIVRAAMLLRCNALSRGHSGIRLGTVERLIEMLNKKVHPIVPEKGSLGASGDLAPLAHIVLTLIGEGRAEYEGEILPGSAAMKKAGIRTVELAAKEGLALINGTQIMTAIGALTLYDAKKLAAIGDIAAAMTGEALNSIKKAYDAKVHELRGHPGQIDSASNLRKLLEGSRNSLEENYEKVQDPYSLRCVPQVHGGSRDAFDYVWEMVTRELNAVTDNPLIFPDEDQVISGGNFHGQPMAIAFDCLKTGISELGNISERRSERLINPNLSEGLPPFLTEHGGVCSGFMITQYVAASMVSENKIYAHPASVDSIPSSGNQEDHVSMGTTAARTAAMILDNTAKILAIELFAAYQAISLRNRGGLGRGTQAAFDFIKERVELVDTDIVMHYEMIKFEEMIDSGSLLNAVKEIIPDLK